jgi:hypothetical protein
LQPLADSLEDEVEEALERVQALEDPTDTHQTQLDGMAKKFSDTRHLVADQLDLHQKVGGRAPPRVAAMHGERLSSVARSFGIFGMRKMWHDWEKSTSPLSLRHSEVWYKTIREAHVNMREQPRYNWRWASATDGWCQKSSAAGIQPVLGPDGQLLTASTDIHHAWGLHYVALATDETGHSQDAQYWDVLDPHPHVNEWIHSLDEHFSLSDICQALAKLKAHCAPGGDEIPTELLKACLVEKRAVKYHLEHLQDKDSYDPPTTPMTDSLGTLLNFVFEKGIVADSWLSRLLSQWPQF